MCDRWTELTLHTSCGDVQRKDKIKRKRNHGSAMSLRQEKKEKKKDLISHERRWAVMAELQEVTARYSNS